MATAITVIEPSLTPASPPTAHISEPTDEATQLGEDQNRSQDGDDAPPIALTPSLRPSLSWNSFRSTITLSEKTSAHLGWIIAFLSVLFTIVALSPAFKSQNMTERALELAEWTALKDFFEECREELAAGVESQACLRVMNAKIPPPPNVKNDILDNIKRDSLKEFHEFNGTMRTSHMVPTGILLSNANRFLIVIAIILPACIVLLVSLRTNRSHFLQQPSSHQILEEAIGDKSKTPMVLNPEPAVSTATVRHPPSNSEVWLRRRAVRTHPIYRHTTLDEAIHAADLSEIRIRLQNGEDVNQHWPYLIYRLAISPTAPDMAKRLEVARLCLDFGADVNAVKGWNGQSALLIAIHFGNVHVARLLIANGAMVSYSPPDSHLTALHRCVRLAATGSAVDALTIMEMLFKYGANANQADRLNETPLHKLLIDSWYARHDDATFEKLFPIALCLVEHGAQMPGLLKDKFIQRNPLYELVHAAIWERSKRVATGREFKREWQLWTGIDNGEPVGRALKFRQEPQGKRTE